MLNILPDTINSLSSSSRANVSSLIRTMRVQKSDMQALINTVSGYAGNTAFAASRIPQLSVMNRDVVVDLFRDSFLRIKQLFSITNSIGLVTNSMISVLDSEIEKVKKDISNLELFVDNYEFLSGKDDYYNSNYVEKFDNILDSYIYDSISFAIPDRDSEGFPMGGNGFVDSRMGMFKIGNSYSSKNVINNIKSVSVKTNYDNYVTSQSDFENVFNDLSKDAWSVTAKSPVILNSFLPDYNKYLTYDTDGISGAQVAVEFEFISSVEMDTLRIAPNFGNGLKLLQAVIFFDDVNNTNSSLQDDNYLTLLNAPRLLANDFEASFSKQLVRKVILLFNQSTYYRSKMTPINGELNSKLVQDFANKRTAERSGRFSLIQDVVYDFFKMRNTVSGLRKNSSQNYNYYSYKFPQDKNTYENKIQNEIYMINNFDFEDQPIFYRSPIFIDLVLSIMETLDRNSDIVRSSSFIETRSATFVSNNLASKGFLTRKNSNDLVDIKRQFYQRPIIGRDYNDAVRSMLINESSDLYEYTFSIKAVEFLSTDYNNNSKAAFVSKRIPTSGQVLGLKAKVGVANDSLISSNLSYDIPELTSYEFSVSTSQSPSSESDWYPLLPSNLDEISSEVLYLDAVDLSCKLRFNAVPTSVVVYKDGMLVNATKYKYNQSTNKLTILDRDIYSSNSIFCARYSPNLSNYNPYEIDFVKTNIFSNAVRKYSTSEGSGQKFIGTGSDRTVSLKYNPYVNSVYTSNSRYVENTGTIFLDTSGAYMPVRVRFSNGSYGINLTNYTGKPQSVSFFASDTPLFIQNGNRIVFDRAITDTFFVEYDYIPDNLRFRLVVRKNVYSVEAPGKVDSVIIKMKTNNYNPYYDKLNFLNQIV